MKQLLTIWLGALLASTAYPQTADTVKVLTLQQYVEIVKQYHPVARQAALLPEMAKAEIRMARGGFDPALYSNFNGKTYQGTNYYSYFESGVKIPVWYGVEVSAGYDFAYGANVSTERMLPNGGLGYLGLSVPLGANLLFDKKRAALKQAELFAGATTQQRQLMLNDLFLNAIDSYYEWQLSFVKWQIYTDAQQAALERFTATRTLALLGDRAEIDTLEALTQLQNRQLQVLEARLKYMKAAIDISNYLWTPEGDPFLPDTTIVPQLPDTARIAAELNMAVLTDMEATLTTSHPKLLYYQARQSMLQVERRLKLESLKPVVNLQYGILSNRFGFQEGTDVFAQNYKLGFNVSFPLTFATARGELKQVKLKLTDWQLKTDAEAQQLVNKLRARFYELGTIKQQVGLFGTALQGYEKLLLGERTKFMNGESSLFLINARETTFIDARLKQAEMYNSYFRAELWLNWTAGNLHNQ